MAIHHARSNSLPSKQHPLTAEFEEQLRKLRSFEVSSSSTSVTSKLARLQDLHDFVDQLILLPHNQQASTQDEVLDGSLRLLDLCNAAKDILSLLKESSQEIQSILRRRWLDDVALTGVVKSFLARKKLAKKALRKVAESKGSFKSLGQENFEIFCNLREIESITLDVIESLLSFISDPTKSQKSNGWPSIVSKFTISKRVVCEEGNEFQSTDAALNLLVSSMAKKSDNKIEERDMHSRYRKRSREPLSPFD